MTMTGSLQYHFQYSHAEQAFLVLQCLLIACVVLGWPRRAGWARRQPSATACLLAIAAGWCLRLMLAFVLISTGFTFLQSDDPCRWLIAWGWRATPWLVSWDGVWLTGNSALHGLAMRFIDDPLMATKIVAAAFCLAPLGAMFVYALGIFDDRRVACAATLATAPLWLHALLSTGAMTEMPTVTFMLGGAGLLMIALRLAPGARRLGTLALAALALALATSFHTTAWMQLAALLAVLLACAAWRRPGGFGLLQGLAFSVAAGLFCAAWMIGCWIKFGHPLHTFTANMILLERDNGLMPHRVAVTLYPRYVALTLKSILPLAIFGVAWGWRESGPSRPFRRATMAAIGLGLAGMVATAAGGRATWHIRSTILISTALMPLVVAPFFARKEEETPGEGDAGLPPLNATQRRAWGAILATTTLLFLVTNYQNAMTRRRMADRLDADAGAMGAWLRQELVRPQTLRVANLALPVRVARVAGRDAGLYQMVYEAGRIDRIQLADAPAIDSLAPDQVLIVPAELKDPRLTSLTRVGAWRAYARRR